VAQDTLENLTRGISDTFRFRLRVCGNERDMQKAIRELPGLVSIDGLGQKEPGSCDFMIESERDVDIRKPLNALMNKLGSPILMLKPMDLELEDIFLQLTSDNEEVL